MLAFTLMIAGCDEIGQLRETAEDCGVSENELREAKAQMRDARPYSQRKLGQCEISVDDARTVRVITKAEMQRIDQELKGNTEFGRGTRK